MTSSALSPEVIAAIDDLALAARVVVEGARVGGHRSPLQGFSTEFRQHRPYQPGDDLKYLDWKAYARTDRLYTRQFRETTNLSLMLVVDTSASMGYPTGSLSKFRYATVMAAALAHLLLTQGDAVGLMSTMDGAWAYLPARGGPLQKRALIAQLDQWQPRGVFDVATAVDRSAELLKRRGVIIVLSDFYDDEHATLRAMRRAVRRGHDVAMWQVIAPEERALPGRGDHTFVDLETGATRIVNARVARDAYRIAFADFLARCSHEAQRDGIDYALLSTDVAPSRALRERLLQRSGHARATTPDSSSS